MEEESRDENSLFSLYFPSHLPTDWENIFESPQRPYAIVGEAINVIVVAKYRGNDDDESKFRWQKRLGDLQVSASVSKHFSVHCKRARVTSPTNKSDVVQFSCLPVASCQEILNKRDPLQLKDTEGQKSEWREVDQTMFVYPTKVTILDLPAESCLCSITVSVWSLPVKPNAEPEPHQGTSHTIKQTVCGTLPVLSPPLLQCRQLNIKTKHILYLTATNETEEGVVLSEVQVLPYVRDIYLPLSSEESRTTDTQNGGESDSQDNVKIHMDTSSLPISIQSCESHTVMTELSIKEANDSLTDIDDVPLVAMVTWSKENSQESSQNNIVTQYRLPEMRVRRPGLVITASCDCQNVNVSDSFEVKYTICNGLQDFLSLRLVWSPEKALADTKGKDKEYIRNIENVMNSVVCFSPSTQLGSLKKGSTMTVPINFQIMSPGVFELGQHMKLNLQYALKPVTATPTVERRESITSTRSMPSDLVRAGVTRDTRSASSTPVHARKAMLIEDRKENKQSVRRGSGTSTKPMYADERKDPKPNIHSRPGASPVTQVNRFTAGSLNVPKTPKISNVTALSPSENPSGITPQQVLKRNFQMYVT